MCWIVCLELEARVPHGLDAIIEQLDHAVAASDCRLQGLDPVSFLCTQNETAHLECIIADSHCGTQAVKVTAGATHTYPIIHFAFACGGV